VTYRFSIELRDPIRLEAFSALARVMRHAVYQGDFPATQESFWILFNDIQSALRAERLDWLHMDRLHVDLTRRTEVITIDLKNTQFIGADHGISSFKGGYEPDIAACIEGCVPNDGVFIDVGANWGYFAVFLACRPSFSGKIIAIEPHPDSFRDLKQIITSLELWQTVTLFPIAASDRSGVVKISSEIFSGNNRLVDCECGTTVYQERLDRMVSSTAVRRVDLIKIDVEGSEAAVLRGSAEVIRKHQPVIIFESWRSDHVATIQPFTDLLQLDDTYRFYLIQAEIAPQPDAKKSILMGDLVEISPDDCMRTSERVNVIAAPVDRPPQSIIPSSACFPTSNLHLLATRHEA
jgi:FkbM family methyltransferase